ncbi:PepSY domain-containing protein [Novosphingobium profundi]|uniref:PepSY-associated TM helix domain-containing protein n=1 Tax=Novosphingobium profundi TaxID=1774954 RepID=UPI001BD9E1E0|nr:PepSY-associated TM helix domain-containing protein [Novosphingobium profundi]MBT0668510.1 PepSY domain-containing protein [Novosphingobium profundi]
MKLRTDIVKMYKEIHGWVGIISGLCLFVAFYAGAITMFEHSLQRWASPASTLPAPVALERVPELVDKVIAADPRAAKAYTVHLQTGTEEPARVSWSIASDKRDEHAPQTTFYGALDAKGQLVVQSAGPSPVGGFIDQLHQQAGLMIGTEPGLLLMGVVSLLYAIALVSGVIVLLPSLVKDLFATRLGRNAKRMWLDLHNVLGLFSLPFHIIMALTAVVFAFHDPFYASQGATFSNAMERPARPAGKPPTPPGPPPAPVSPATVVASLAHELPGFTPKELRYGTAPNGTPSLQVRGEDPRYGNRGPNFTVAILDPATGTVTGPDYLGGQQDGWGALLTGFFTLHFGSFGGIAIRWAYFVMGLAGAFLFYTGNLLWVESRRKRERRQSGPVVQSRATRILGALTVGAPLGCVAGSAVTIAAAKPLAAVATLGLHSAIYHAVFFGFVAWALVRGSARAAIELLPGAALALLTIPLASLAFSARFETSVPALDAIAVVACGLLVLIWRATLTRVRQGPRDSVWSLEAATPQGPAPREETAQ